MTSASDDAPPSTRLVRFGVLHAGNTALNMGFTLLQLLVLSRILPFSRYSEVVFLTSVGLYLQPFDQAIGKANFVTLQPAGLGTGRAEARPALMTMLGSQALLLIFVALAVPCMFAGVGSSHWMENVLFLFLCLAINFWAFELQSTAWALNRNVSFVEISIAHRCGHFAALALAFATGRFLLFGIVASLTTIVCLGIVLRIFAREGLFANRTWRADWAEYRPALYTAFLSTLTDFLVLNAPYALIASRYGIGPLLIMFDSVMKVGRIAMAGSRTLAEIALPHHSRLMASARFGDARRVFWLVVALCLGATAAPALGIMIAGSRFFKLLLGGNEVVPSGAMPAAALVILAAALYQPTVFFLSYGNRGRSVQALTAVAAVVFAVFAAALYAGSLEAKAVLGSFGLCFLALGVAAAVLTNHLYRPSSGGLGKHPL